MDKIPEWLKNLAKFLIAASSIWGVIVTIMAIVSRIFVYTRANPIVSRIVDTIPHIPWYVFVGLYVVEAFLIYYWAKHSKRHIYWLVLVIVPVLSTSGLLYLQNSYRTYTVESVVQGDDIQLKGYDGFGYLDMGEAVNQKDEISISKSQMNNANFSNGDEIDFSLNKSYINYWKLRGWKLIGKNSYKMLVNLPDVNKIPNLDSSLREIYGDFFGKQLKPTDKDEWEGVYISLNTDLSSKTTLVDIFYLYRPKNKITIYACEYIPINDSQGLRLGEGEAYYEPFTRKTFDTVEEAIEQIQSYSDSRVVRKIIMPK